MIYGSYYDRVSEDDTLTFIGTSLSALPVKQLQGIPKDLKGYLRAFQDVLIKGNRRSGAFLPLGEVSSDALRQNVCGQFTARGWIRILGSSMRCSRGSTALPTTYSNRSRFTVDPTVITLIETD